MSTSSGGSSDAGASSDGGGSGAGSSNATIPVELKVKDVTKLGSYQAAAVSDGRKSHGVEGGTIDQPQRSRSELASDLATDVVTGFDDHISAEFTNERFIGRLGHGQHRKAVGLGQLDCVSPDGSRRAHDGDRGPRIQCECIQREAGGDGVE